MLATVHVLTGAALARRAPSPGAALALGLASHPALDALPHWGLRDRHGDPHDRRLFGRVAVVDGLLLLVAGAWVLGRSSAPARDAAGMLGGLLLDLDKPAELVGVQLFPGVVQRWHSRIQTQEAPGRWPLDLLAGALAAVALRR